MKLVVPKELTPGEQRVALVPGELARLTSSGVEVAVQQGAGELALYADEDYEAAGAKVSGRSNELFDGADLVAKVQPPMVSEVDGLPEGVSLLSFLAPSANLDVVRRLADRRITAFSFELVPRISRAQQMDALSSQATVAGYKAVLIAANKLAKFFPLLMTAAGTVPPARVLVLGAGVAGLQAIATARRLGAVVTAYDVRPAAKEEVKSVGASFLELGLEAQEGAGGYAAAQSEDFLSRQQELIGTHVAASDVVITTAAVPGGRAPLLVSAAMVNEMRPGSVIVDLAAASGGNCELTDDGKELVWNGVYIVGAPELAASMPTHASALYARNVSSFVRLLVKDGKLAPDFADEVVDKSAVTISGSVHHEQTRLALQEPPS
ncbi:MAG TPA: Re/Si-specific NAD(P)(+) transhydrogenase subunit alpha [Acidimicrobiales bacterium]|nr:Re/Si-specific NAD(P)(+) transhydrogenase subunit alpha [Acidimicrobiales bacterium]